MHGINPARVPTAQKPVYETGDSLSVNGETLSLLCASLLRLARRHFGQSFYPEKFQNLLWASFLRTRHRLKRESNP